MLLGPEQAGAFLLSAALITLAPGPDNLMVLSHGIARGRWQGIAFGLGCASGCLSHTLLASLGLSALIASSTWAFAALKACGGGYLIWLGVGALRNARRVGVDTPAADRSPRGARGLFINGFIANAVNPKVIVFFFAFLPQFVDAGRGWIGWQIFQLGVVFTLQAAVIFAAIGYFSGHVGCWLARSPRLGVWLDRLAGSIFMLLGARLIASR